MDGERRMQYGMQGYNYPVQTNYQSQKNNGYRITVEGKGNVIVKPDQAKMTIGIVTENQQLLIAQQENTSVSNRVINALKQLGIEEGSIKTTLYNIQPQYDYIEGKSVFKGYQVDHQLEVTIKDITKVGAILDAAFKNGANRGGNVQFVVSNTEEYYREALKRAVNNARVKAEAISQTIGASLRSVPIKVIEKVIQPPERYPVFSYKLAAESAQETPPIQKGEFTIDAFVTVVYEYRERN